MSGNVSFESDQDIDAVILWVDGNDPVLAEKRNRYLKKENISVSHSGAISTRFASSDEIRYCVLSILKFASFVRNIFIVTDKQDPGLNEEVDKYFPGRSASIRIVDHSEIFRSYEKYLPTFNSSSILSMIWRIEGLAEHFFCLSDDVFLVRELKYNDWFADKRPVLRGYWRLPPLRIMLGNSVKTFIKRHLQGNSEYQPRISFYLRQWKSARLAGMRSRYFFHCHTPHPLNRTMIEEFFNKNPELLEANISYRFRDKDQFLLTSLAYHLEILSGNKNFAKLDLVYLHPYYSDSRLMKKISECKSSRQVKFVCVQSMEMLSENIQENALKYLDSILNLDPDDR
ncbi:MAG: Stealth CR1 domain-containing protein [Bacteroidales bacterium]|nr:Stealth CR1 domain-containing protein [Bacteroidales bacterium]